MRSAAFVLLLAAASAQGQICQRLEFAELESLSKEELLKIRCDYQKTAFDPAMLQNRAGLAVANRCASETERMDRILARKYQLKATGDAVYLEVNALCRKQ